MQPIKGYEGLYSITKDGEVFNDKRKRFLKKTFDHNGYPKIGLYKNNVAKNYSIHRLVATTFLPNHSGYTQVNHKNFNRADNRVENLEWCTGSQNVQWSLKGGRLGTGENHYENKLSFQDVEKIKHLIAENKLTKVEIAEKYKVSPTMIGHINKGRKWNHEKKLSTAAELDS